MRVNRFQVPPEVSTRRVGDEMVLLDLKCGEFFVCKGTGPQVWDLIAEGRTLEEIAKTLSSRYALDEGLVKADLDAFVYELIGRGLLAEDPC